MAEHRAVWTDDCQGKKDYDGGFLRISSRFWPGEQDHGEGMMVTEYTPGKGVSIGSYKLQQASAVAAIIMVLPADDTLTLREAKFTGANFKEVSADVEAWVQSNVDDIVRFVSGAD